MFINVNYYCESLSISVHSVCICLSSNICHICCKFFIRVFRLRNSYFSWLIQQNFHLHHFFKLKSKESNLQFNFLNFCFKLSINIFSWNQSKRWYIIHTTVRRSFLFFLILLDSGKTLLKLLAALRLSHQAALPQMEVESYFLCLLNCSVNWKIRYCWQES